MCLSVKTIAKVAFSHYTRKYNNVSLVASHLPVDLAFPKIIICHTVRDFIILTHSPLTLRYIILGIAFVK